MIRKILKTGDFVSEKRYFYIYNIVLLAISIGIFLYPFIMPYLSQYKVFEISHIIENAYDIKSPTDGVATDILNFVKSFPFFYKVNWNNPITPLFILILITNIIYRTYTIIHHMVNNDLSATKYKEKISKDVIICAVIVLTYYIINLIYWFIRYYVI